MFKIIVVFLFCVFLFACDTGKVSGLEKQKTKLEEIEDKQTAKHFQAKGTKDEASCKVFQDQVRKLEKEKKLITVTARILVAFVAICCGKDGYITYEKPAPRCAPGVEEVVTN